jgi:hypothetical protein
MALHFSRIAPATKELEIWSANERGFSFVISNESSSGPGLHGRPGFVASWRPINFNSPAIRVGGSPFKTLAEAEKACEVNAAATGINSVHMGITIHVRPARINPVIQARFRKDGCWPISGTVLALAAQRAESIGIGHGGGFTSRSSQLRALWPIRTRWN